MKQEIFELDYLIKQGDTKINKNWHIVLRMQQQQQQQQNIKIMHFIKKKRNHFIRNIYLYNYIYIYIYINK